MSETSANLVRYERIGSYAQIMIDREERRNALNVKVAEGIARGIDRAEADPECRSIVLTGAGTRAFCAGGDLQADKTGTPFDVDFTDPRSFIVDLLERMNRCRLPIIARVNGHAMAGGFGIVSACDMVVVVEGARLGTPESRIGIFPMMILPHMMRTIPSRQLMEMCITGEPFDAVRGYELGLVNYVVKPEELDAKIAWLTDRIAQSSPTGIHIGKIALGAMRDMTMEQGLEYAQVMLQVMSSTPDSAEGFRSFQEKRKPHWADLREKAGDS